MTVAEEQLGESGVCNTALSLRFETPEVAEAGVDTLRVLYEMPDADLGVAAVMNVAKHARQLFGDGTTLWPLLSHHMLAVECHPGALLGLGAGLMGHGHALTTPERLVDADVALRELLGNAAGIELGRTMGASRLDTTVTLDMGSRAAGLALLQGLAVLDVPRLKPNVHGRPIETVYLEGRSGEKYARAYDWGVSRGLGEQLRGRLIRLEDQRRFRDPLTRPRLEQLTMTRAKVHFHERFLPLHRASHGITCASLPVIVQRLAGRVDAGELTRRQAGRLIGALALEQVGCETGCSRATRYRHRRELREHGLVVADGFYEPVELDVGAVLTAAMEADAWGAGG